MKEAGILFGPRLAWNPHTKWGLAPLAERLLGKAIPKDVTLSDWETPLTPSQIVYAGTDVIVCYLLSELMIFYAPSTFQEQPAQSHGAL